MMVHVGKREATTMGYIGFRVLNDGKDSSFKLGSQLCCQW